MLLDQEKSGMFFFSVPRERTDLRNQAPVIFWIQDRTNEHQAIKITREFKGMLFQNKRTRGLITNKSGEESGHVPIQTHPSLVSLVKLWGRGTRVKELITTFVTFCRSIESRYWICSYSFTSASHRLVWTCEAERRWFAHRLPQCPGALWDERGQTLVVSVERQRENQ